jgi:hypothetical protein
MLPFPDSQEQFQRGLPPQSHTLNITLIWCFKY